MLPNPRDLPSSMVVFLIALPLSMGIAIASGVPPALGLVTAIIGGLVVGLLGGAHLQISGPSAGLAVLVAEMVGEHGLETFAFIVMAAGALQLLSGALKLGRLFQAVSPAVVRGMLSGIGILIIASQFHVMIDDSIHESGLRNIVMIPAGVLKALANVSDTQHLEAAMIGVSTLLVTAGWDRFKSGQLKMLPGPLLGVVLGAGLAAAFGLPIRYVVVPETLLELVQLPSLSVLGHLDAPILFDAVGLAFVASAETLLCATAVAGMHDGQRTGYDRELAAQGMGNMLCGLVGALPMTGVISRSTANVQASAATRWSAVLQSVWIGLVVILFPAVLALVPMSSLAAVLVYIGFKLVNVREVRKIATYGRPVILIFVCTVLGVVMIELLTGIIIGLLLSAAVLVYRMSHVEFYLEDSDDRLTLHLIGAATVLALPRLAEAFEALPPGRKVHIHFDDLTFIDHSCLDRISSFTQAYERNGGTVVIEWDALVKHYEFGPQQVTEEVMRKHAQ
ncbi:MAG: MFS superfamily sulfate permease-like transporter [Myxococcota bacterium]|jgi:MFS superfamily sulfate permease-like transporter